MGAQQQDSGTPLPPWVSASEPSSMGAGLLSRLWGTPSTPTISAPPLSGYPSSEDAAFARANEQSYGSGNEAYAEGRVANVMSSEDSKDETGKWKRKPFSVVDAPTTAKGKMTIATNPDAAGPVPGSDETADIYQRAELAVKRSPIAALGYDPSKVNLDVKSPKDVTIAGLYDKATDQAYVNATHPSTLVHESIHRGLQKLRDAKDAEGKPLVPEELWKALPKNEEYTVRRIMAADMGDPEKGFGELADRQREVGLWYYGRDSKDPRKESYARAEKSREAQEALDKITTIAARHYRSLRPGGPK